MQRFREICFKNVRAKIQKTPREMFVAVAKSRKFFFPILEQLNYRKINTGGIADFLTSANR